MISYENNKFYISTKVVGIGGAKIPGKHFGFQGNAMAKIHAQPLMRDIAANPEQVEAVTISDMVVRITLQGKEHPIGIIDKKYTCIAEKQLIPVRNFEIRGYEESLVPGQEYRKLGLNITFEVTAEQKDIFLKKNPKEVLHNGNDSDREPVQNIFK